MKRYSLEALSCVRGSVDGEWIRYADHIEAMRIAGAPVAMTAAAAFIERKADDYAREFGTNDMGSLSFGNEDMRIYHWHLVELADEIRALAAPSASAQKAEPKRHCQNGGDVCLAGNRDGVCCPEDSCDIDDGVRAAPAPASPAALTDEQILAEWDRQWETAQGTISIRKVVCATVRAILAAPPESRQGVASGEQQAGPVAQLLAAAQEALTVIGRIRPEGHGLGTEVRLQRAISAVSPSTEASRCDGTVAKCPNECSAPCSPITSVAPIAAPAALTDECKLSNFDGMLADLRAAIEDRDYARAEVKRRDNLTNGTVWYWQGDGTDRLESLTCDVVIRADDLRALLAASPAKENRNG